MRLVKSVVLISFGVDPSTVAAAAAMAAVVAMATVVAASWMTRWDRNCSFR
jgi:PP-loop superfamily ATP-utilizing enzyme